jgi:hypothetical protein
MAPQPVSFNTRAAEVNFGGFVGAERQVDHHQRAPGAAHHRIALQDHHVERDGHRAFEPVHHHAERVPNQDDIAIAVEDARGMRVIRGQANERRRDNIGLSKADTIGTFVV